MMSRMTVCALVAAATALGSSLTAEAQKPYKIEQRWTIGGDGSWDYLTVDSKAHRLYVAHQTAVEVVDLASGKKIGSITGLTRCHGVVISPDGKTGFISDGGANAVVVFDPSNLATVGKIAAGTNPDGMVYEPSTKTLWAFNGGSNNATVIDIAARKAVGTVAMPGKPEFPVADGQGMVFVNIEDKNAVVRIDAKTQKSTATWKLTGCEAPSGNAIDTSANRLFAVCDGKKMAITDSKTGKSLATPPIGDGPDATAYDANHKVAFSSNGESGTLTVIDTSKAGFPLLETLKTEAGARTMALDSETGKVYLATATLGKKEPGAKRASALPGSFAILVVGRD